MGTIGIVANPNSGKDIRRIVSYATTFNNQEKISIVKRILSGIYELGDHHIYIMPDDNHLGYHALDGMSQKEIQDRVTIPDIYVSGDAQDTSDFVDYMAHELKADVIIVLGGDGTSRAAAKTIGDVPLIPVSTGTNNVYPQFIEGTVVAIAAAALADNVLKKDDIPRGKLIEVSVSDGQTDIGLIDAVVSRKNCIGARAITDEGDIDAILVTQSHPANIGFSALIGSSNIVLPEDDYGVYAALDWQRKDYVAAISVGVLARFGLQEIRKLKINEELRLKPGYFGTIALDGEREITFCPEDTITMKITRNGPRKVDVAQALQKVVALGYLHESPRSANLR